MVPPRRPRARALRHGRLLRPGTRDATSAASRGCDSPCASQPRCASCTAGWACLARRYTGDGGEQVPRWARGAEQLGQLRPTRSEDVEGGVDALGARDRVALGQGRVRLHAEDLLGEGGGGDGGGGGRRRWGGELARPRRTCPQLARSQSSTHQKERQRRSTNWVDSAAALPPVAVATTSSALSRNTNREGSKGELADVKGHPGLPSEFLEGIACQACALIVAGAQVGHLRASEGASGGAGGGGRGRIKRGGRGGGRVESSDGCLLSRSAPSGGMKEGRESGMGGMRKLGRE